MKSLILLIGLFLLNTIAFAQKTYEFDHLLEYDFYWDHKSSKPTTYFYLTNSQNNTFTAVLTEKDSVTLKFDFLDHKGNHAVQKVPKDRFTQTEDYHLKCSEVKPHSNTKKSLIKRFDFRVFKDTIISGNTLGHYILKSKRNDDSAIEHFIIDKAFENHLPILRYATAFGKWESTKTLPNGIIFERYLMDTKGRKRHKLVLKKHTIIYKTVSIPEDCDYSK